MNDEQIRDSLRNLAATAPRTDIWPRISGQVEQQKPRRALWPHLRLRPLLVGLDALAIAALLFITVGPLGLVNPPAQRLGPNSGIAHPATQPAGISPTQATNDPIVGNLRDDGSPYHTLTDFVQRKAGDPDLMLPTYLPAGYKLSDIDTHGMFLVGTTASGKTVTETIRNHPWQANYQRTSPNLLPRLMDIRVGLRGPQDSSADFYKNLVGDTNPATLIARYQRPDRSIELYHNDAYAPKSQIAYVFVNDPNNSGQIMVAFIIEATYEISNDDLLKLADSIEQVDPEHLTSYRYGRTPEDQQSDQLVMVRTLVSRSGIDLSTVKVKNNFTLAELTDFMDGAASYMLPSALPAGYKMVDDIGAGIYGYDITDTTGVRRMVVEPSQFGWYVEYHKDIAGQDQQIMRLHESGHVRVARAGDTLRRSVTLPNPLDAVGNPSYEISGGYTSDSDRLTARYRRPDRIIELYHDVRLGPSQDRYAFVYFANQDAQYPLTQVSIYTPESMSDAELLKMADSIERVDPQRLADYQNGRSPAATPVADSTNQSPASPETWATLRQRPLALPSLAPGAGCPTSTGKQVSPDFGLALGDGPVYPVGFGASGSASYQGSRVAGGWYFLKV
ncbi:MAG: hypothetical protein DLM69_07240, partial [Candidatus Chloroheliales bacterium]